ncbi:MAG: hypothetical protein ABDH59_07430, partial [Fervidobacterium sp.]
MEYSFEIFAPSTKTSSHVTSSPADLVFDLHDPDLKTKSRITPNIVHIQTSVLVNRIKSFVSIRPQLMQLTFKMNPVKVKWLGMIKLNVSNFASTKLVQMIQPTTTQVVVEDSSRFP